MIKLLYRFAPNLFYVAKVGNKYYYRLKNSDKEWNLLKVKPKNKTVIDYDIPEDIIQTGDVNLTAIDSKVSMNTCYNMLTTHLEGVTKRSLKEYWFQITPIKKPIRWNLKWVSLRHKDITLQPKESKSKVKKKKK